MGAFFIACSFVPLAQALCPTPKQLSWVAVKRVVDGDTVQLADGRRVRLIGINTPELAKQGRRAEAFAQVARSYLQTLVAQSAGRIGLLLGAQAKDRYGRTLAYAYDQRGRNIEAQMLLQGLAYAVAVAPNTELAECQFAAEGRAREAHLGVWKKPLLLKPAQIRSAGFSLIQGRVQHVQSNDGGVWLDMGDSLVLQISPRHMKLFDLSAIEALVGRQVEARGWLLDRQKRGAFGRDKARWLLPLTGAAMLQVLP